MKPTNPDDTIAAISTPPGEGGIGIVRLSGPQAIEIAAGIFCSSGGRNLREKGRVFHGEIRDGDDVLDEVLVHVMRKPRSYTCEDVVEINAHGGAAPLNAILELALARGARLAGPGEFTKRAFLNGRIDLAQAEAVIDSIRAHTRAGLLAAAAVGRGRLSKNIHRIAGELRSMKAQIESAVDFSDQDLPEPPAAELRRRVCSARDDIERLLATADAGRLYREGASVAIAGRPNVGKSSLFNALLGESRAIVTAQPGTTRDLIEEQIAIQGMPLRLTDTAGLRDTGDEVEQLGVRAARRALNEAAVILLVMDVTCPASDEDEDIASECRTSGAPIVRVWNKIDLALPPDRDSSDGFARDVSVSAKSGAGLNELESAIVSLLIGAQAIAPEQAHISRLHQKDSLRRAVEALERLLPALSDMPEIAALELEAAMNALGEITGETTPDDVLETIFAEFCVGK